MDAYRDFVKRHQSTFDTLAKSLLLWSGARPPHSHYYGPTDDDFSDRYGVTMLSERKKSSSAASRLRNEGNVAFGAERIEKALDCYTKSIAFAPGRSEDLALAFGNRSAALYRLQKYDLCILDVNRALRGRFPDRSKQKLLERRKKAVTALLEENKLKSMFAEGKNILLPNESFDRFNPIERKMCHIVNVAIRDHDLPVDHSSSDDPIWKTKFDNDLLPNVSSKVKFEHSSEWGRHWVAKDDISPGEILAIEDLFGLRMKQHTWYDHCSYCSVLCEALIPCPSCTTQMYCSQVCCQEAYDSYHRTECEMLPSLAFLEDYVLALRMFLTGTKQGSELVLLMNNQTVYKNLEGKGNCVGVHYPADYLSILNLAWRMDKMDDDETFPYMFVTYMINALRRANFFGGNKDPASNSTEIELFAGILLCQHCLIARQYFGSLETQLVPSSEMKPIGSGVSPFVNLMNHSCYANTTVIEKKRRKLVYCVKPIKSGEQIFAPYLLITHNSHDKAYRNLVLDRQCYTLCRCLACIQDWPLYGTSSKAKNNYITSNEMVVKKIEKMHQWLRTQLTEKCETGPTIWKFKEDDLKKIFEFNKYVRKFVKEPSPVISVCEEFILKCMETKANIHITLNTTQIMKYLDSE